MPLATAFGVWQALNLLAILVFYLLWTDRQPHDAMAIASFVPLWNALYLGQDTPLLLAVIAVASILLRMNRRVPAGIVLSFLSEKPHLFVLVPLFLLRHRLALVSFVGAGAVWAVASFALEGLMWPVQMIRASTAYDAIIQMKLVSVRALVYPNGSVIGYTGAALILVLLAACLIRAGRLDDRALLATSVFASVCLSHHALLYDAALSLPLLLLRPMPSPIITTAAGVGATMEQTALRLLFWVLPALGLSKAPRTLLHMRVLGVITKFGNRGGSSESRASGVRAKSLLVQKPR
jgi:hypothetical protein